MSTINVPSGGNIATAGGNAGDTVLLAEGSFGLNGFAPTSGVTYRGVRGKTTIRSNDNSFAFRLMDGRTLPIFDVNFDGGAVDCQGTSTLNLDWCEFTNFDRAPRGAFGGGLAVGSGGHGGGWKAINSKITNGRFYDGGGPGSQYRGWAVGFYTCDGFEISNTEFINITNALKGDNGTDTNHNACRNLLVLRNFFDGIRRMGAEFQGGGQGFRLIDNVFQNPILTNNLQSNLSTFAFSTIFADKFTHDCIIRGNHVTALKPDGSENKPDGEGLRIVFEIGPGFTVEDNYANAALNFAPAYMGDSTQSPPYPKLASELDPTIVRNNRILNIGFGQGNGRDIAANKATYTNNGPNVQLTWDYQKRGRPLRGGGWSGGVTFPPPDPIPTPIPTPTPSNNMNLQSSNIGPTTVTLKVSGTPANAPARVEFKSTSGGQDCGTVQLPAGDGTYNFENLPLNWKVTATMIVKVNGADVRGNPLVIQLGAAGLPGAPGPTIARLAGTVTPPTPTPTKRKVRTYTATPGKMLLEFDDGETQVMT